MSVLIPLTDGFSHIELASVVEILRKAGVNVQLAGLVSTIVESEERLKIITSKRLTDININDYNILVLVGGLQYKRFLKSSEIKNIIRIFIKNKKIVAALSQSAVVPASLGLLDDRMATVYPGLEKNIPKLREGKVIIDKNIITTHGPLCAPVFAIKLVEILKGKNEAEKIKKILVI